MNANISNLYAWDKITSNDGVVSITNDGRKARFSGGIGSGAQLWMRLPINHVGIYKVSFYARKINGSGYLWIVDSNKDKHMNSVLIDSNFWVRYELSGGVQLTSDNGKNYIRISMGIATGDDGDIEISDICVTEINQTFGQLRTIAGGIISVLNGEPSIHINHGGIVSVSMSSDYYTLDIKCSKLHQSLKTPMILITEMESGVISKSGVIRARYYDKVLGTAKVQLVDVNDKKPKILSDANLMFNFEVRSI